METRRLFDKRTLLMKQIALLIFIALLITVPGIILPINACASSSKLQPGINKTDVKNIEPGIKEIQKPVTPKNIKKKSIIKPAAKPFLQIKKVYIFPKDKKLRVVIQNTGGGDLSRKDYFSGKLEIRLLGTSTRWWWPLAKVKGKGDHYVTETTFNTNKILSKTVRLIGKIKGVKSGKPWIGKVLVAQKNAPKPVKMSRPEIDRAIQARVQVKPKQKKMVYKSSETPPDGDRVIKLGETEVSIGEIEPPEDEADNTTPDGKIIMNSIWFFGNYTTRVDRNDPSDIEWRLPIEYSSDEARHFSFKVELLNPFTLVRMKLLLDNRMAEMKKDRGGR